MPQQYTARTNDPDKCRLKQERLPNICVYGREKVNSELNTWGFKEINPKTYNLQKKKFAEK